MLLRDGWKRASRAHNLLEVYDGAIKGLHCDYVSYIVDKA
jgi:hypothetical protein